MFSIVESCSVIIGIWQKMAVGQDPALDASHSRLVGRHGRHPPQTGHGAAMAIPVMRDAHDGNLCMHVLEGTKKQ